ncbi:hypothetical protein DFA_07690 [Cavenderia fasciculata]|uniref:Uncharacterized protein n=1 Tax=Cavenderia fasciculata TaxID=261658 RepID=F4Q2T6_CACFS|nr:uncharacterized protein DFA_07690 [Cavenderia fasciculata]EGG16712.1 hypothetical protein DFA_07690 [Cavenderia fasciculata]|eukprot:XP_004355186.1 hypothetical protein DFA_07690 [Cavenderia fasciculata]
MSTITDFDNSLLNHIKQSIIELSSSSSTSTSTTTNSVKKDVLLIIDDNPIIKSIEFGSTTTTTATIHVNNHPTIYKYNQIIDVWWMLDNGYINLLHYRLDRNDYIQMYGRTEREESELLERIFQTKDYALVAKMVDRYRLVFLTNNSVDLSCYSGRLDVFKLILSIQDPDNIPISVAAVENAIKSGSLELVQFLDTTFHESCSLSCINTRPFCESHNQQIISYFLSKMAANDTDKETTRRKQKSLDGLTILCTLDFDLINQYLYCDESNLEQSTLTNFVMSTVFFFLNFHEKIKGYPHGAVHSSNLLEYLGNSQEYIVNVSKIIPIIFKRTPQQMQVLHNKIFKIMENIDSQGPLYQPLYNMLVVYEILVESLPESSRNGSEERLLHNFSTRGIIRLGVTDKSVLAYIVDKCQPGLRLKEHYSVFVVTQYTALDQLDAIIAIDPTFLQYRLTRLRVAYHQEVFDRLVEIGVLGKQLILQYWGNRVGSFWDSAWIRYLTKNATDQIKGGSWKLEGHSYVDANTIDIVARLLIEAGVSLEPVQQMPGIQNLCQSNDNYLIKYMVATNKCCDVFALGGAILGGNFQLFDHLASIKDVKPYNVDKDIHFNQTYILFAIEHLISLNDFERFKIFRNRINHTKFDGEIPTMCIKYSNTEFFSQLVAIDSSCQTEKPNMMAFAKRVIKKHNIPFLKFILDRDDKTYSTLDLNQLFREALLNGCVESMYRLVHHSNTIFKKDIGKVSSGDIINSIKLGHLPSLVYLYSLNKFILKDNNNTRHVDTKLPFNKTLTLFLNEI